MRMTSWYRPRPEGACRKVIASLAIAIGAAVLPAQTPVEGIIAHMDSLDAMLQAAAKSSELRSTSLKVTDRYMASFLKGHVEVSELLRINSKGQVTSEVVKTGKPGQRYRSVASQQWYKEVVSTLEPYYGSVRTRQGRHQLFWAMPVVSTTSGGQRRSAGALLVKLDLATVMATAASRVGQPYMVEYGGKTLYQHQWKGGVRETTLFDVKGMSGLKLVTVAAAPPPAAAPAPASQPPAPAAVAQPAPVQPETKAPVAEPSAKAPRAPKPGKRGGIAFFLFPVLLVIAALVAVALWRVISRVVDVQQEKLLRDIEAQVGAPAPQTQAPAGQSDAVDLESLQSSTRSGGLTRRIPVPDAMVQAPPMMGPQAPARVGGPVVPPVAPVPQPVQPSYAPPSPPPAMGLGPQDYDYIRQQVRAELVPEIRAQLQKEFDQYRRDVERGAEAFGAEIEMTLHQLIGKISEMGDNPTRLTEVAGAAVHELNAIVNRYRNQNK